MDPKETKSKDCQKKNEDQQPNFDRLRKEGMMSTSTTWDLNQPMKCPPLLPQKHLAVLNNITKDVAETEVKT